MAVIVGLLVVAGIGTIVSSVRTIHLNLQQESEWVVPSPRHLRAIAGKFASLDSKAFVGSAKANLFTPQEREAIGHAVGGPRPQPRAWKMF
jgi:hypothetical protein